jgi:CubicO group peptidase (beta-lactamase class C family)
MNALHLVSRWPVPFAAAAVVGPHGVVTTWGDQDRVVRLASLSKPMSAWAMLVAVEEGIVELDQPMGQPGCTLRHLLSHAGGYPFDGRDPMAPPERTRAYSNGGIEIAADEVAAAAGMAFDDYLREAVFEPLAMHSSDLRGSPAHQVWSTCADTARFVSEMLRPQLLASDTAHEAARAQYPTLSGMVPGVGRFSPCPWGLGVEIAGDKSPHWTGRANSPATFGHFGGAGTMMWADPVADCGLVALTDRPFDEWADEALRSWSELSDAVLSDLGAAR